MKKFVFIHNIGDWIFRTLIIIILISIILHSYPYLILLASLIGIVICYYLIHKSKEIKLFDDFFTISNILSKNNVVSEYNYSTIEYVKFVFASIRGGHTLFFCFKESPTKNTIIQFNYNGIAPERELHFLKSKGVNVVIYPKNKLKL